MVSDRLDVQMPSVEPHRLGFLSAGQGKLYYEEAGSGEPLVFIHAGIADSRMWDAQFKTLSQEIRVVRYDMRGFGETVPGSDRFTDWEDLAQLIEFLKIEPSILVGSSMGAKVAVELALMRPDLVRALVLVSPGLFDDGPRSESLMAGWGEIEQALDAGQTERAIEIEVRLWVVGPTRDPNAVDPMVLNQVLEMNTRAWELAESAQSREDVTPPAVTRLGEIKAPTLIVAGDSDQPDILKVADRLMVEIENARLVVVEHAAHMLNMEHPALFTDLVKHFIVRLPPQK